MIKVDWLNRGTVGSIAIILILTTIWVVISGKYDKDELETFSDQISVVEEIETTSPTNNPVSIDNLSFLITEPNAISETVAILPQFSQRTMSFNNANNLCISLTKKTQACEKDIVTPLFREAQCIGKASDCELDKEAPVLLDSLRKALDTLPESNKTGIIKWSAFVAIYATLLSMMIGLVIANGFYQLFIKPIQDNLQRKTVAHEHLFDNTIRNITEWPRDDFSRILLDKEFTRPLSKELDGLYATRLINNAYAKSTRWEDVSKLLHKVGRVCRLHNESNLESKVEKLYYQVRILLKWKLVYHLIGKLFFLFVFAATFYFLNLLFAYHLKDTSSFEVWGVIISKFTLVILFTVLIYTSLQHGIRWLTEKTWGDLDDLLVGAVAAPVASMIFIFSLIHIIESPQTLPKYIFFYGANIWHLLIYQPVIRTITILLITWVIVYIFNRIIVQILKEWALRTKQRYDDMFVSIVQVFGSFLLVATGVGILLVTFQDPIQNATGIDNVILPYSIVVSVFSAILGYASREAVENFFGGVLLQIDKPFEIGERLILATGEICDVREIGMRSTILYNVVENTEISIPNTLMSNQMITNISRPDLELRIRLTLYLRPEGYLIRHAELVLLDLAYLELEVDQMRIEQREIPSALYHRGRRAVREELERLEKTYPKIADAKAYRIVGGGQTNAETPIFPDIYHRLDRITQYRIQYDGYRKQELSTILEVALKKTKESPELSHIARISPEDYEKWLREITTAILKNKNEHEQTEKISHVIKRIAERESLLIGRDQEKTNNTSLIEDFLKQTLLCAYQKVSNCNSKPDLHVQVKEIFSWFKSNDNKRYGILQDIVQEYNLVSEYVYAIADAFQYIRPEMDILIAELNKEPVIHSEFDVSDEAKGYVKMTYNVFTLYLERRFEVVHKLNKNIQRRFDWENISLNESNV